MYSKFQYSNSEERDAIVEQNSHLYLVEEQNLFEGNFLIFSETPLEVRKIEVIKETIILTKEDFDTLRQQIVDLEMAMVSILGGAI